MNKLKVKGLNAIFDLRIHISVGDTMIVAVASGTAAYLVALPPPQVLEVRRADCLSVKIDDAIHTLWIPNRSWCAIHRFNKARRRTQARTTGAASFIGVSLTCRSR